MEEETKEENIPEWRGGEVEELRMGKQLTAAQLDSAPGRTSTCDETQCQAYRSQTYQARSLPTSTCLP